MSSLDTSTVAHHQIYRVVPIYRYVV